ncbi:MbtH family protein [Streptomyces argenteolus]|uniref:MbtH family protein n=1 Tax=Streptomyces argenteolus TaxID=67274 RepID=A0ABW6X630_9ACTN
MGNPFDDSGAPFHVLVNDEGQHSLWPASAAVPDGWSAVLSDATHEECVAWVDTHWTDMRPRSLASAMDANGPRGEA